MADTLLQHLCKMGYSESEARGLILAGRVLLSDRVETHVGYKLKAGSEEQLRIKNQKAYVSRAAWKLKAALEKFQNQHFTPHKRICLDLGASHGGFSQVLLENGAQHIYAIDVAHGIFDYQLRTHPRISVLERCNIRHIQSDWFADNAFDAVDFSCPLFVVCDIAFMSLRTVLESLLAFTESMPIQFVLLFKPQFENSQATEKGILKNKYIIDSILEDFVDFLKNYSLEILGWDKAAIKGRQGNQEYVFALQKK